MAPRPPILPPPRSCCSSSTHKMGGLQLADYASPFGLIAILRGVKPDEVVGIGEVRNIARRSLIIISLSTNTSLRSCSLPHGHLLHALEKREEAQREGERERERERERKREAERDRQREPKQGGERDSVVVGLTAGVRCRSWLLQVSRSSKCR